jgi:hypothetical protein
MLCESVLLFGIGSPAFHHGIRRMNPCNLTHALVPRRSVQEPRVHHHPDLYGQIAKEITRGYVDRRPSAPVRVIAAPKSNSQPGSMHQGTADLRADGKPHNSQEPFHPEGSAKAGAELAMTIWSTATLH